MVILSTNKKNTKKNGKKLFVRRWCWKKNFCGDVYVYKNVSRKKKFFIALSRKSMVVPKYGKRPLLLEVSMKHVLWLVETVYFIIVLIHGEKAHQCVWFQFQYFSEFIQNSNFESYVSEEKKKQRATCLQ